MADRGRARDILTRLRNSGIQISIDGFGRGYGSLSFLGDLPIDELKLDRSLVFPMADDAGAAALVVSAIGLAHSLGLRLVTEGVETNAAYTELVRLGCDQAQGYYVSRPVPTAELDVWLNTRGITDELTEITGLPPSLDLYFAVVRGAVPALLSQVVELPEPTLLGHLSSTRSSHIRSSADSRIGRSVGMAAARVALPGGGTPWVLRPRA